MSREHTPRPGVTWQTEIVPVETVIRPGWAEDPGPSETATPEHLLPGPPRPNRAARRAQARAARKNRRRTP